MPVWIQAAWWGAAAGAGLLIGAVAGWFAKLTHRFVAVVMAFGAGVLIAVLSVELMTEAYRKGGAVFACLGFITGAIVFCLVNWFLSQRGAKHRNRCGECVAQAREDDTPGSGLAIALGAILDGIPESMIVGLSLAAGGRLHAAVIAGFFLANVPQGLSSTAGLKEAGRSAGFVFGLWTAITVMSAGAALLAALVLGGASHTVVAIITAFAAGGIVAMLAESMIPEAFEDGTSFIGLVTAVGFLVAFVIGHGS